MPYLYQKERNREREKERVAERQQGIKNVKIDRRFQKRRWQVKERRKRGKIKVEKNMKTLVREKW